MAKKKEKPQEQTQTGQKVEKTVAKPQTKSSPEIDKDSRMWAMFCHLGGIAGLLPVMPLFGSVILPLVLWQVKKEQHAFIDEQGKEALNFQISILIYIIASIILCAACIGALFVILFVSDL